MNKVIKLLSMALCLTAAMGTAWSAQSLTIFQEDFEGATWYAGDDLNLWDKPYIGGNFMTLSGAADQFLVSDTQAVGTKSISVERGSNGSGMIYFFPDHVNGITGLLAGQTLVMEMDVFIPTGSEFALYVFNGGSQTSPGQFPGLLLTQGNNNTWYVANYDASNVMSWKTAAGVNKDMWNHVTMELYADLTYSVWITPQGGDKRLIADKAGLGKLANSGESYDLRPLVNAQAPANSLVYCDNVKLTCVDDYAQGYPTIFKTGATITIDGVINTAEWAGAEKVASRTAGGIGSFRDQWLNNDPLNPTTYADTYVTYDASNFYIAHKMNNVKYSTIGGTWNWWENSHLQAVFFFDNLADTSTPDNTLDVSYIFRAGAAGAVPSTDPAVYDIMYTRHGARSQWGGSWEGLPYTKTLPAGCQISYSVNTTTKVMQIEMKIPFSAMPELTNTAQGAKIGLSFNLKDDTGRALTSITGEEWPYLTYYGDPESYRNVNPQAGVTLAKCGDMAGDFVADCVVNTQDIIDFAKHWLDCNANCQ